MNKYTLWKKTLNIFEMYHISHHNTDTDTHARNPLNTHLYNNEQNEWYMIMSGTILGVAHFMWSASKTYEYALRKHKNADDGNMSRNENSSIDTSIIYALTWKQKCREIKILFEIFFSPFAPEQIRLYLVFGGMVLLPPPDIYVGGSGNKLV